MANLEHVEKLLDGVDSWNQWRVECPDIIPDFSSMIIGDEAFMEKYRGSKGEARLDLSGANLSGVDFSSSTLTKIQLNDANLQDANFYKVVFEYILCHQGDWTDANLSLTQHTEPEIVDCEFQGCNFSQAKFWNGANLRKCNFWCSNFDRAVLSGVVFDSCTLGDSSMMHVNLEFATLIGSDFWSCNLENANLWKAHCQGVNFLSGNLKSATLTGANLSRANLEDACLEYANLTNVDLRFVNMSRSNFEHANMTGVLFNKHSNYRGIRTDSSYGSPCFKRFANDQDFVEEFKEIVWDPLLYWRDEKCQTWAKPIPMGLYLYWFWDVTSDCGRSLLRWSLFSVFLAVVYGFIFYYLGESSFHINQYGSQQLPWSIATTMYFSVITFSTLGYGDIVPITSLATLFIIAEVITGYIMLGGLISILAGKMARRA